MRRGVSISLGQGRQRGGPKRTRSEHGSTAPGSGPQAASSDRRAYSRRRPRKRRATSSDRSVSRRRTAEDATRCVASRWCFATENHRGPRRVTMVRVGCAASAARAALLPGTRLVHKSGLGKVCDLSGREFHRRGPGKEPRSSWAEGGPPEVGTGRRRADLARPTRSLSGT